MRIKDEHSTYLSAPDFFMLQQELSLVAEAFDSRLMCMIVGSVLETPDFRDVDIRIIMPDEQYAKMFTADVDGRVSQRDPLWLLICTSISFYLSKKTGLPIDFQIQSMKNNMTVHANKKRVSIGVISKRKDSPND